MLRLAPLLLLSLVAACAHEPPQGSTPFVPTRAMSAILQERQAMRAKPLSSWSLNTTEVRDVPSLSDAGNAIPNVVGLPAMTVEVKQFSQLDGAGANGMLLARLYRPAVAKDTPVIIYFPGGTWVTGTLDQYDDTARQLAARTGYVVLSVRTRLAPEVRFPAEHDDALAAYQWARMNLRSWGADPTRVVLAGEGPGANLALSTALAARDAAARGSPVPTPDALLLITPWAGTGTSSPSMSENGGSRPLPRSDVRWANRVYAGGKLSDPRIDLVDRVDFSQMPPTTIILAQIDPLRSGGETLAARMQAAGVPVQARLYQGVTYDFFGLGTQVPEAAAAESFAAERLRLQFAQNDLPVLPARVSRSRVRR